MCYYQNVRGLRSKMQQLFSSVSDCEFDLICLVETALSDDISSSELFPHAYKVFRCDRQYNVTNQKWGGGALLAVKEHIVTDSINVSGITNALPFVDVVACKCVINFSTLYVIGVYIPPGITLADFRIFIEYFEQMDCCRGENVLILGDFNLPHFNNPEAYNSQCRLMSGLIDFLDLKQYNSITNILGRLLDLVLTNIECEVSRDYAPMIKEDLYHPALYLNLRLNTNCLTAFPNNPSKKTYNFRKANFPDLYNALLNVDWSYLYNCTDVNAACEEFYAIIYSLFDLYVPLHGNKKRSYPVWYTPDLIKNIKLKNNYHKKYKLNKNVNTYNEFKRLRSLVKSQISTAYNNYLHDVEQSVTSDSKHFWSFIQMKKGTSRIPGVMRNNDLILNSPEAIVNALGEYFSSVYLPSRPTDAISQKPFNNLPVINITCFSEHEVTTALCKLKNKMTAGPDQVPSFLIKDCSGALTEPLLIICNLAIQTSTFPDLWKTARICPVLKSGDSSLITNYRPISILSNFAKVFEILLYSRIYPLVKKYISPYQHGFMENRSTISNLAYFTQFTSEVMDAQGQVDVIYTDFSKAFDRIDHKIIITKLNNFGFSDSLMSFFMSYLNNRSQHVTYNSFTSRPFVASSGVPQGSNLGPLLFLLFVNDLTETVSCEKLLFADDLKIFSRIHSRDDCEVLQTQINRIQEWCVTNNLHLNISKCKVVTYTKKLQPVIYPYICNGILFNRCTSTTDLGINFDYKLSFSDHIDTICRSAMRMLGFIIRNCRAFSNVLALKSLFFAFVRSKLEYGALIWYPLYECHKESLELVQRRFLKFLSLKVDGHYPTPGTDQHVLLSRFGIQSLELRRIISSLTFLYNLLNNKIDCASLLSLLQFNVPPIATRKTITFYCPTVRTNLLAKSPIFVMSNNYNRISNNCDINCCSLRDLKTTATNCN